MKTFAFTKLSPAALLGFVSQLCAQPTQAPAQTPIATPLAAPPAVLKPGETGEERTLDAGESHGFLFSLNAEDLACGTETSH